MFTRSIKIPETKNPETKNLNPKKPEIGTINVKELISEPGATGITSDYKDVTDPKYIGPGTWNVIHRNAFAARTNTQQSTFIQLTKDICYGFPCYVCKGHCTEYIKNHPMEDYLNVPVDINGERLMLGLFVWAWKFHNAVNARLNKPIMSWETSYNLYLEKESLVCSKNCLEADGPVETYEQPQITSFNNTSSIAEPFRLVSINRTGGT